MLKDDILNIFNFQQHCCLHIKANYIYYIYTLYIYIYIYININKYKTANKQNGKKTYVCYSILGERASA